MNRLTHPIKRWLRPILRPSPVVEEPQPLILNEAVNFDTQSIFIAIPKTGTTSVRRQLSPPGQALIRQPHLSIMQVRDTLYAYLLARHYRKNSAFPTEGVPADDELRADCRGIFASFFKFASVRNPWARAVSLFSRREGVRTQSQLSFEAFCEQHRYASDTCEFPTLHRNQLDWLVGDDGSVIMDYIYKVEEFQKAIDEIRELTSGRVQLEYRTANRNSQSKSQAYRSMYTDHTRRLIARHFEKDIDHFKYSF